MDGLNEYDVTGDSDIMPVAPTIVQEIAAEAVRLRECTPSINSASSEQDSLATVSAPIPMSPSKRSPRRRVTSPAAEPAAVCPAIEVPQNPQYVVPTKKRARRAANGDPETIDQPAKKTRSESITTPAASTPIALRKSSRTPKAP